MTMMLARHFTQPRRPYQEPCSGTGLVVDVEPITGLNIQHAECPDCKQSIVLTTVVPSAQRGGDWARRGGK